MAHMLSLHSGDKPRPLPTGSKTKINRKSLTANFNSSLIIEDFSQEELEATINGNTQILLDAAEEEKPSKQIVETPGTILEEGDQGRKGKDEQCTQHELRRSLKYAQEEVDDLKGENAHLKQVIMDIELEVQSNAFVIKKTENRQEKPETMARQKTFLLKD